MARTFYQMVIVKSAFPKTRQRCRCNLAVIVGILSFLLVFSLLGNLYLTTHVVQKQKQQQSEQQQHQAQQPEEVRSLPEQGPRARRTRTDTGVDLTDPALYETVTTHHSSETATVMGMASGYDLNVYQRFVGSLRKTGYQGHIILGVAPDVSPKILEYFHYRNVTPKILQWVDCTYNMTFSKSNVDNKDSRAIEIQTCADPYSNIKIRWSRFPLARDWLNDCPTCTGPVLIMDVRDSFFQRDPFVDTTLTGLQVYEEHKSQTTQHWLAKWPLRVCKGVQYTETMLCSGTTTGTRAAMLAYLTIMYEEMKVWISNTTCHFEINGDDQSIHNYLFYSGQLPFATAMPNRAGGIVHTVGVQGALMVKQHQAQMLKQHGLEQGEAMWKPFDGAQGNRWIGKKYNIVDDQGLFTEFDGSRSRVIHQWDRWGRPLVNLWMPHQEFLQDPMPKGGADSGTAAAGTNVDPMKQQAAVSNIGKSNSNVNKVQPAMIESQVPKSPSERRTRTDTGIDLTDPALYESIQLSGDSSTATVMGMASGYELAVYQRFVGSLRKAGYQGHIILGVAPDVSPEILEYFKYRRVTPKILRWVNCTYAEDLKEASSNNKHKKELRTCAYPYADIKIRWSRFPLARDWLRDCDTCTGPVLIMDVRDSLFQLDPFGMGSPTITGLQVYEEDKSQTTQHWLTQWPIGTCKGVQYNETMLCSGTTSGTRAAMLKYLDIMYAEMKVWINEPRCRFGINGDDQSMHNYLYYSGQLPFATAMANRAGGIVNTVGVEGAKILHGHQKAMKEKYGEKVPFQPFEGADGFRWIGEKYNFTDEDGFFTEADGVRSRVVHQYDRLGGGYVNYWLRKQDFARDGMPPA